MGTSCNSGTCKSFPLIGLMSVMSIMRVHANHVSRGIQAILFKPFRITIYLSIKACSSSFHPSRSAPLASA